VRSQDLVIVGAGGLGREVLGLVQALNCVDQGLNFIGFVCDPEPEPALLSRLRARWLGPIDNYLKRPIARHFVVGVGDPHARRSLATRFEQHGLEPATLIHPTASIGPDVIIGDGSIVCSHVSITTNVRVGKHVIVNPNSTIGHDCRILDFVTVSPLVAISGNVTVAECAMLGTGSAVIQKCSIGEESVIGAGAVVISDVNPRETVVGVPGRAKR